MQLREILVLTAIDDQAVSSQMIFDHQALDVLDQVSQERISRVQVGKIVSSAIAEGDLPVIH